MIRQSYFIAVVGAFLVGCVVLVVAGCSGVRSEAPQEEQGHTEATNEQTRSPEATASEEARCSQTRTITIKRKTYGGLRGLVTTNDVPGCTYGGLLSGTDKADTLYGLRGDDEIHGLDAYDSIHGGEGNDVIYGGPGWGDLYGDRGEDVLYRGNKQDVLGGDGGGDVLYGRDGNDSLYGSGDHNPDKLYCGEGRDYYYADKNDYVDSSCEKKGSMRGIIP